MRRMAAIALAMAAAGCGATRTVTETVTVTTSAPATQAVLLPPDPRLQVQCNPEPDQPPVCTQGNYQVQPPVIGAPCDSSGDVWEWNEQYNPDSPIVCSKPDPSHLQPSSIP